MFGLLLHFTAVDGRIMQRAINELNCTFVLNDPNQDISIKVIATNDG